MLEGEYTTYAMVWSRDYGAGVLLDSIIVDNFGTVYGWDSTNFNAYARTYAAVETNTAGYRYWMDFLGRAGSDTIKYMVGSPAVPATRIDVWRDGVNIFNRDVTVDEPLINALQLVVISPNGKFIGIIAIDAVTGQTNWLILYEGT